MGRKCKCLIVDDHPIFRDGLRTLQLAFLEGDFVDEDGSHQVGTYVRNPPGSRHAPSAPDGTTIFVKLSQFGPDDMQFTELFSKEIAAAARELEGEPSTA